MNLESILEWYQQRIGLYDKQSWETTVERRILRGLSYSPRKATKQKTDLIDVDLVRGSTFPKAKPQSDIWLAGLHGIIRILLLPIYYRWWIRETTYYGFIFVVGMYSSITTTLLIYFILHESNKIKVVPGSEVLIPAAVMILLSVILSQMACTRRQDIKAALHRKRVGLSVRSGRKSRSSRKNSVVAGLKGKMCSCSDVQKSCPSTEEESSKTPSVPNSKNRKVFEPSCRSHSEELHPAHLLEAENRSVSETNLASNYAQPNSAEKTEEGNEAKNMSPTESVLSEDPSRFTQVKRDSDCNIRYRGYTGGNYKLKGGCATDLSWRHHLPVFSNPLERSSDCCSDGEEGCHADCESPSTDDEEEVGRRERKSKFKLGKSDSGLLTLPNPRKTPPYLVLPDDGSYSSCDSDGGKNGSSFLSAKFRKYKPLFGDWIGINSEDPSYSSESEAGWDELGDTGHQEPIDWHIQGAPAAVISSTTKEVDKVGCKIWEDTEMKKVDLSVLDISSAIISRVDSLHQSSNYLMFGLVMGGILSFVPSFYRLLVLPGEASSEGVEENEEAGNRTNVELRIVSRIFGDNYWCFCLIVLNALNRLFLASCFFFILSVAERTFKQRFLYAKHFSYLTSARRARKYDLPHFRLNKVINIKSWLSIRSCLKKRGPQHSVDVIISATFIVTLLLVFYLGVEALKDEEKSIQPLHNCELFVWCFAVSIYLIRFMTLGALINKKYSNPSVLITEQINMYLHMEQNPQKKDTLMLANNVLKLVSVLLKELDSPFKISGLSANTLLYNVTKFGILSACSGVLSNLLGFKLKLHNIIKFR